MTNSHMAEEVQRHAFRQPVIHMEMGIHPFGEEMDWTDV